MFKRFSVGFASSSVLLVIGLIVLGLVYKQGTIPTLSGSASVHGISDGVTIDRDSFGIPHINAATDADAYFGLGYAEAQDRLFQMEMARRIGEGRLCEIVGKKALVLDVWSHTIGFSRIAHQLWLKASPQTQKFVTSYVNGINAYLADHRSHLGFEFDALQFVPENWSPEESVMIGRLMSWELNFAYWTDAAFSDIALAIDTAHLQALFPHYPDNGSTALEGATPQAIAARWNGTEPSAPIAPRVSAPLQRPATTSPGASSSTQSPTPVSTQPPSHTPATTSPKKPGQHLAHPGTTNHTPAPNHPTPNTTQPAKKKPPVLPPPRIPEHLPVPPVPQGANATPDVESFYAEQRKVCTLIREYLGELTAAGGSNSFALGPTRTRDQSAMLENDTHLRLGTPSRWYLAHLKSNEGLNVAGFGIPGLPLIIAGRNEFVSWGITSGMADESDFFSETTDSAGRYYQSGSQMMRFTEIVDSIRIRDSIRTNPSTTIGVYIRQTVHGPIISDHPFLITQALVGNKRAVTVPDSTNFRSRHAIALAWNGEYVESDEVGGFFALHRAKSIDEGKRGLKSFATPILNLCLADRSGAIGYAYIGRIPRRAGSEDHLMMLRDGRDLAQSWQGFASASDIASVSNPARGYIVSANDPPTRTRPIAISNLWETSARADRIAQLIEQGGSVDAAGATAISMDVTSPYDRDVIMPTLLALYGDPDPVRFQPDSLWYYRMDSVRHVWRIDSLRHHTSLTDSMVTQLVMKDTANMRHASYPSSQIHYADPTLARALEYLRNWDGGMRDNETAPTIYAVFLQTLLHNTYFDELGPDRYSEFVYLSNVALNSLERIVADPQNIWWDDVSTSSVVEDRDSIFKESFNEALRLLKTSFGSDLRLWQWGRLHKLTYHHQFESGGRAIASLVNIETGPAPGGLTTVSQAGYDMWNPYELRVGPSMRMVADMKTTTLLAALPTGNSEAIFGPHYRDEIELFKRGGYDAIDLTATSSIVDHFELHPRP